MAITEEIARLTGKLVFQVDNRPLMAFEKRLAGVINMLGDLEKLANKKFNIKVQLDSRTLREQLAKASNAKVTLKDVNVSQEALTAAAKRITDKLNSTPITLSKVRVDITSLVQSKKLVRTLLGQMQINIPLKFVAATMEAELRKEVKEIGARNPIKLAVNINANTLEQKIRKAVKQATRGLQAIKVKIANPEVQLKVDKHDLVAQIQAALNSHEFRIRVGPGPLPRDERGEPSHSRRGAFGGGLMGAGMGFARGALPGLGAAFAIGAVNQINQQLVATNTALEAVSGSAEGYASNLKFLEDLTKEQGRNMRDVAPQFNSILASAQGAIGNQGTQDLFRGVMKYGTVMGLDQEAMKGSLRAISQMFSKDKIQAEEAQGQLAERLPAAMQLLAKANNTDVKGLREQMQKGSLDPKKVLPQMAKIMEELAEKDGAYRKSLESTRVAQGRMNRQFEQAVRIFAEGGFDKAMNNFFTAMADGMERSEPLIKALGGAFDLLMRPILALIKIGATIGENWDKIANIFGMTGKQLAALGIIAGIALLPFGTLALAIAGVALAAEDLIKFSQGGKSLFGTWLKETIGAQEEFDKLKENFTEFQGNIETLTNSISGPLKNAIAGLTFSETLLNTIREINMILQLVNNTVGRHEQAKQFATTAEGTAEPVFMRYLKGFTGGSEYMNNEMNGMGFIHNEPSLPHYGNSLDAASIQKLADAIRDAQTVDALVTPLPSLQMGNIIVQVQGIVSAEDLTSSLKGPMEQVFNNAFGNMIKDNSQTQSRIRK